MIEITDKQKYKEVWNSSKASILQSFEWGEVKNDPWIPRRFDINKKAVTILIRKLPLFKKYFGYIPRGFDSGVQSSELEQLLNIAKTLKLSHLIIDPFIEKSTQIEEVFKSVGFKSSGTTIQPNQTNIVDLSKTEEELWMNMKGNYRRNYKKSVREGCIFEVYEDGEFALEEFYKVMEIIFHRTDYVMHGFEYFKKVWETLSPQKFSKIYLAKSEDVYVGAYLVVFDNDYAYELYGGVTNAGRRVEAGYFLKWEAIKDAKKNGKKYYDHWGVAPFEGDDYMKKHELYHISKFKEGFGGRVVEYMPQMTIYLDKKYQYLFSLLQKVQKIIIGLKKRIS